MKRFLLFLLVIASLTPFAARASHIAGEEIYYKNIGPNTYRVYAVFYGTCQGMNFKYFYQNPFCVVYAVDSNSGPNYTVQALHLTRYSDSTASDSTNASTYCPSVKNGQGDNCTNPSSPYQGYVRYVYSATVQLPNRSPKWRFVFLSEFAACGSFSGWNTVANFMPQGSDNFNLHMYATLNNTQAENSSPVYSKASNFNLYCPSASNSFLQASTDADHDSLAYSFSLPYYYYPSSSNCGFAPKILLSQSTYTYTQPLPGIQTLNSRTGELDFNTGGAAGDYLVFFTVSEYRNKVLVGTSQRQRIISVNSSYCGVPAVADIDTSVTNILGATVVGHDSLYLCPGSSVVFQAPVKSTTGDSTTVSFSDILGGSTVSVNNNGTQTPVIRFAWNTAGLPYGVYTLTANLVTNSCPLPTTGSITYTFIIGDAGDITYKVLSETDCIHKAAMQFQVDNSSQAYNITLVHNGDTIRKYDEPAGTLTVNDSLEAGGYLAILKSAGRPCTSYINFDIYDSGPYPYNPILGSPDTTFYCRNFKDTMLIAYTDSAATYLKWYDGSNNSIPEPVYPSTANAGTYIFTVSQVYKFCESGRDTLVVVVDPNVCDYDADIHNVITPNGDGKNDVWEIDHLNFYPNTHVTVFDKLGDKVFEREHYGAPWWDGGTVPSGVYYYIVDLGKPNIQTGQQKYTGYIMIKR